MNLKQKLNWHCNQLIKYHFPFLWSRRLYKTTLGKVADFKNPKDLNEKIQWLMFYTDTSLWTQLADKYAVREYVKERIGEEYLIPLLGVWHNSNDIDFEKLPDKFIIKPNNGSYDAVICHDKTIADLEDIRKRMAHSLKNKFGYENAEPHYLSINPCVIAEELLETDEFGGLKDYKIWCFNGKPYCIFLCANRDNINHQTDFVYYDLNWDVHNEYITAKYRSSFKCQKPDNLDGMLQIAAKLSEGLPQVRVDLYYVNNRIYFGELTMSSNFGMMPYFTQEALNEMGSQIILPKRNISEIVSTYFKRWFPLL